MTNTPRDHELQQRFERQRESLLSQARPFDDVLSRGRLRKKRPSLRRPAAAGVAAVLMVVVVLVGTRVLRDETPPATADVSPHSLDLGAVTWRGPTDFLLETPGREFLLSVPTISAIRTGSPDSTARPTETVGRGGSGP